MIEFKKILVPVDFSEPSKKAVTYGLTFADRSSAKLIIAHIVPESSALLYAFPTETSRIEREQEDRAKREIVKLLPATYARQFDVETIVKTGSIEAELLGIVKNEAVDLVIMGTRGRRNFGRWFLGSVTEHMLRKVPVPLLTVSHVDTDKHMIGLASLKRVLYATDLQESSDNGLKYAISLARTTGADLTIVHIVHYPDRRLWAPGGIPDFEIEQLELTQAIRKSVDRAIAQEQAPVCQIEPVVVEGKPHERILEIAEERGIDVIVINLQSKSMLERAFLGSTAERVVRLAPIPVLSIPPGTE